MSKLHEKPNPNVTRSMEEQLIDYRAALREAEEIMTLRAHPGWTRLVANVNGQLQDVEMYLDNFEKLSERDLVLRLKERKDFRWVIGLVDKLEEKIPDLHSGIANIERTLADRKAKSGQL